MKKIIYKLKSNLLSIFGDIKIFKWPMFLIYQPTTFKCKGPDFRKAESILKPGDLVFRKYKNYLDGYFIPGKYSHCGFYIGNGKIVHAIAEGVVECDLIDYLRCDAFCILRPKSNVNRALKRIKSFIGKEYDFNFESSDKRLYCHELGAKAYEEFKLSKWSHKFLFGLLKSSPIYTFESFQKNKNFKTILEVIP